MTKSKTATATRIDGDVYNVTYPHARSMDRMVPWSYIRGLLKSGYTIQVDQTAHRPAGEAARQTYTRDDL